METKTIAGIFGSAVGIAFLLIALLRTSMPRQKRWIFAYTAICFFVFAGL